MTTINEFRVISVDGSRLTLHANHGYGWHWDRFLVSSRTMALQILWEPLMPYSRRIRRSGSGRRVPEQRAQKLAESSPLWPELGRREPTDESWNRDNVGRFISCVGLIDRQHHYEMWNDCNHEYWYTNERGELPEPQATFLISVTDPRWLAHITPEMEWDSTAYDHDVKIVVNPAWRTSTVTLLEQGIYDERDFSTMPILADALQDAGCDCDDILNHLRDPNATHVRGCWALDLVLGKV